MFCSAVSCHASASRPLLSVQCYKTLVVCLLDALAFWLWLLCIFIALNLNNFIPLIQCFCFASVIIDVIIEPQFTCVILLCFAIKNTFGLGTVSGCWQVRPTVPFHSTRRPNQTWRRTWYGQFPSLPLHSTLGGLWLPIISWYSFLRDHPPNV